MRIISKRKKSIPTKVVLKVSLECMNFPVSFKIYGPYERVVECFKYFEDEIRPLQQYEIFGVRTDFDRVLKNVVTETSMAMKVNRLSLDYEKITKELGYAPDFIEFHAMANKVVTECMEKLIPEYQLNVAKPEATEDVPWFKVA